MHARRTAVTPRSHTILVEPAPPPRPRTGSPFFLGVQRACAAALVVAPLVVGVWRNARAAWPVGRSGAPRAEVSAAPVVAPAAPERGPEATAPAPASGTTAPIAEAPAPLPDAIGRLLEQHRFAAAAARLSPDAPDAWRNAIEERWTDTLQVEVAHGDPERALDLVAQLAARFPNSAAAGRLAARAKLRRQEALSRLTGALAKNGLAGEALARPGRANESLIRARWTVAYDAQLAAFADANIGMTSILIEVIGALGHALDGAEVHPKEALVELRCDKRACGRATVPTACAERWAKEAPTATPAGRAAILGCISYRND
jgi:hypothetical protein